VLICNIQIQSRLILACSCVCVCVWFWFYMIMGAKAWQDNKLMGKSCKCGFQNAVPTSSKWISGLGLGFRKRFRVRHSVVMARKNVRSVWCPHKDIETNMYMSVYECVCVSLYNEHNKHLQQYMIQILRRMNGQAYANWDSLDESRVITCANDR